MRVTLVAFVSLIASVAFAQLSNVDQSFVGQAAQANLATVKLGELGVRKGSTSQVRSLAQNMIDDHQKLGEKLQSLSTRENFSLPAEPSAEQRATYERLSALSGVAFDRAFIDELKKGHEQTISLFQNESENGGDAQLKSFAQSSLPALRHHQMMVNRQSHAM
jgi:putative membrane protein